MVAFVFCFLPPPDVTPNDNAWWCGDIFARSEQNCSHLSRNQVGRVLELTLCGIGGGKNLRASLQNMIPSGENLLRRTPFDQGRVGWLRKLRHTRRLILSNCLLRRDFLERGQFGGTVDLQPAKTILSDTAGRVPSSEKPSARISRSTKETKE
jgi:hypothetical protein